MVLHPFFGKRSIAKLVYELVGFVSAYDIGIEAKSRMHQIMPMGASLVYLICISDMFLRGHLSA